MLALGRMAEGAGFRLNPVYPIIMWRMSIAASAYPTFHPHNVRPAQRTS